MSNQRNDHYNETYWDFIEEQGQKYLEAKRKPANFVAGIDEFLFKQIKNINK